jgi:ubiquinone/menaquinone biosynthesis C-methylase UbiE
MQAPIIQFTDGVAYERFMGRWSQSVGHAFLDWLSPAAGLRWLDVGCGNGAFSALIAQRCAPTQVHGIDPSEAQLAFAREHVAALATPAMQFDVGDAMALPFEAAQFDVAVMPLVIFFVPQPAQGVAEMVRVVAPGGWVTAYAWDMHGGGFPYAPVRDALQTLGATLASPPSPGASRIEALQALWLEAGLQEVETRVITVSRTFEGFQDYWETILLGPSIQPTLAQLSPDQLAQMQALLRERLPADAQGRITCSATANAVKGRVPRVS